MLTEILLVFSAPDADGADFICRDAKAWQIIISMQFIPKSIVVIVNEFFHVVNLTMLL